MKQYVKTLLVSSLNENDFINKLNSEIEILQHEQLEVEIQYSATYTGYIKNCQYTALLLGYKC